jgi:hypothetical protein
VNGHQTPYRLRDVAEYEEPRYFSYLRETARALRQHKIPYLYSFCPNAAEQHGTVTDKTLSDTDREAFRRREIASRIVLSESQMTYNAMEPLYKEPSPLFIDEVHLKERGVEISMDYLSRHLPQWLVF